MMHESTTPPMAPPIQWGQVGWSADGGVSADLGDSTNDGNTLVRVTLFAGRVPDAELDQTQAQGQQLLCQLAQGVQMPARGTLVIVATPEPFGHIPGGSVILAAMANNYQSLGNAEQGELVIAVPGSPASIVLRKDGTIVIKTGDTDGNTSFIKFAPGMFKISTPAFNVTCDETGIRLKHYSGAHLSLGAIGLPAPLSSLGSYATLSGGIAKIDGTSVLLGPEDGAVYFPAAFGPDPAPAPLLLTGLKSSTVKMTL